MCAKRMLTSDRTLALLAENPRRMRELRKGSGRAELHAPPARGEWSANGVLAHLRACADVWGGCIARILADETPTLRAVNPRTWIKQTDYLEQDFARSFNAFVAQRAALLRVLERLSPRDWERWATVTGAGKPLERTVLFYAQWLGDHERPHVKQMERIVKAGWRE